MTKIAIFDSGIGGTTVLDSLRERAPFAELIYVADHAFGPYGERTLEEVRSRTELLSRFLVSAGVSEIVIACNSASAAALHHLREVMPEVAFVGMEPAIKPAIELTRNGVIGVLATGATFQGELFRSLIGTYASEARVIEQACPGLAAAIEDGGPVGELLDEYLTSQSDADVVVLGCTHYPLIRSEIMERLGEGVIVVDPSGAVAEQAIAVARENKIDLGEGSVTHYWTTGDEAERSDGREWETIDIPRNALFGVQVCGTTLAVISGDITEMLVDVVVNAANKELIHGGGVALAISQAGGEVIDQESAEWIDKYGPLESGAAALTSAGSMPSSYVVHVAGPIYKLGVDNRGELERAVAAALNVAVEIGAGSIAIPAISAGVYGYPGDEATRVIAETVTGLIEEGTPSLRSVRLVGYDKDMAKHFVRAIT